MSTNLLKKSLIDNKKNVTNELGEKREIDISYQFQIIYLWKAELIY